MKAAFLSKPWAWNLETSGESWHQGEKIEGHLTVRNTSDTPQILNGAGLSLAWAEVKKIHGKTDGALKPEEIQLLPEQTIQPGAMVEHKFSFQLSANCGVTDKKGSYFLGYGQGGVENHLMLKIEPAPIFSKIIELMDVFKRFKLKEIKTGKKAVEYKFNPPQAREMANLDGLTLMLSFDGENLLMNYLFQVRKLDTSSVTTKLEKVTVKINQTLSPKDYSLGKGMFNQDGILKSLDHVMNEVKLKSVF